METVERFTNRVENYAKYRPSYPPEVLRFFKEELGLTIDSTIADIGSGTGISTKIFLENGNVVYAVEPNEAMRRAAENFLVGYDNFHSVDGTSEATALPDESIDFVTAAQAFHWFKPEETRAEFRRILKPEGYVALIWNERQLDSNDFLRAYEQLLLELGNDYQRVRHENISEEKLGDFFPHGFNRATFPNAHESDFDGLLGRVLSSSYMPTERDARFPAMKEKLRGLFTKYAENDRISILYDTNVFYGKL